MPTSVKDVLSVVASWLEGDPVAHLVLADLFEEVGLVDCAASLRTQHKLYIVTHSEDYTLAEQMQDEISVNGSTPEEVAALLIGEYEFTSVRERNLFINGMCEAPTASSGPWATWSTDRTRLIQEIVDEWRDAYDPEPCP